MTIGKLRSKKYGHDLSALLDEALNRGLDKKVVIDPHANAAIRMLADDYCFERRFVYRVTGGTYHLPLLDVTRRVAQKLSELTLSTEDNE